jgi:excinuclease ABC subunit A
VGDWRRITAIEVVDQNPMGKSSRSNPVTYLKAYDDIRNLFAAQKSAQLRGYAAKHFSFNTDGGRCTVCQGDGYVTVEMQFMADVHLTCEQCHGKRFMAEVLEVEFQGKSISDILELTVDEAMEFFSAHQQKKITDKLRPLADVGLGYIQLGQSSSTLSGGEAQRVKLASFLARGQQADPVLFVFDEPTTGLHMDDVQKLLVSFDALIALGHTVLVVEHHRDVLASADWLIELGPDGGPDGGHLLYAGDPRKMGQLDSPTAKAFR